MAKILLIETASEVCSTAISVDGKVVAISENLKAVSHVALLTLQIQECTKIAGIPLAQLDAVAVSRGPGAYTALRVGVSVAKGICYALDKPLIAIDTLLALAHASRTKTDKISPVFVPMLDARRDEVWLAVYDADMREIAAAQPLILQNNSLEILIKGKMKGIEIDGIVLCGNGMEKISSGGFLEKIIFSGINYCAASHLAACAEQYFQNADFQDIVYFEPFYMKPPNITVSTKSAF